MRTQKRIEEEIIRENFDKNDLNSIYLIKIAIQKTFQKSQEQQASALKKVKEEIHTCIERGQFNERYFGKLLDKHFGVLDNQKELAGGEKK